MVEFVRATLDSDYEAAATLFREYAEWLGIDLGFQKFDEELHQLKSMYAAPVGGIILYKVNDKFMACVAIRKLENDIAELKRMYVQPSAQGKGIGTGLLNEAMQLAKECGYKKIRLDTLSHMVPAMTLYKKNGFKEIPAYYHNPQSTAVYFEKDIS